MVTRSRAQFLPAGILLDRRFSEEADEIPRLFGCFEPVRGRRRNQMSLQFVLPKPQHLFIGRNFRQQPAKLGRLLGSHSTVLIQVDWLVRHECVPSVPIGVDQQGLLWSGARQAADATGYFRVSGL
jgi:hypothetical protein